MTSIALHHAGLPPPRDPGIPSHTLYDGEHAVGWTQGLHIGFTGFATAADAAGAAWVAHRAIARRLAREHGQRPIPVDVEPLSIGANGDHEIVFAAGRAIARLHGPGALGPDTAEPAFSFELELAAPVSEVRLQGLAHLAYHALRRSGIRWALWDRARRAAASAASSAVSNTAASAGAATTTHGGGATAAGDPVPWTTVAWRALAASVAGTLLFIAVPGLRAAGLAADALLLLAGVAVMGGAMAGVSRWRARRLDGSARAVARQPSSNRRASAAATLLPGGAR